MAYATQQDLINRYGDYELNELAADPDTEQLDENKISAALSDAAAEINSYLGQRYHLPLESVPEVVVGACCDLARYRLYANNPTDEVSQRYEQRIKWLRDIATQKAGLGLAEKGASSARLAVAVSNGGGRTFSRKSLSAFAPGT